MHVSIHSRAIRVAAACVGLGAFACVAQAQSLPNPLLQYKFDEGGTGSAVDTGTGDPAPGLLMGPAVRSTNTPSGTGSSIDLNDDDTAGNYAHVVTAGDVQKLDSLGGFTTSSWVNLTAYAGGNRRVMSKQAAGSFAGFSFGITNPTGGAAAASIDNLRMNMFVGGTTGFAGATTGDLDLGTAGEWSFVAVTYDGASTADNLKFYLGDDDANSSLTLIGTFSVNAGPTVDSTARFGVGFTDAAPTSNQSLRGLQDDVRVYGSALSIGDLNAVRTSNLVAVPEPATLGVMAAAGLLMGRRRR